MTVVTNKYRGTKEYFLVHRALVAAAQYRGTVGYIVVARILKIRQTGHHMASQVGHILGEISEDEVQSNRPMLSALAVGTSGVPSDGFFQLAKDLGQLHDDSAQGRERFWNSTRKSLYELWQEPWRQSLD